MSKVIRSHSFWTIDHAKCWFEWIIENAQRGTVAIGAFGSYRQEAIRNSKKKVKEQFPNLIFENPAEVL